MTDYKGLAGEHTETCTVGRRDDGTTISAEDVAFLARRTRVIIHSHHLARSVLEVEGVYLPEIWAAKSRRGGRSRALLINLAEFIARAFCIFS